MNIHLKSKVFDVHLKFNKNMVLSQVSIVAFLTVLLFLSRTAAFALGVTLVLLIDLAVIVFMLFDDFSCEIDGEKPKEKEKEPATTSGTKKTATDFVKKEESKPVMKLDIPVPDVVPSASPPDTVSSDPVPMAPPPPMFDHIAAFAPDLLSMDNPPVGSHGDVKVMPSWKDQIQL